MSSYEHGKQNIAQHQETYGRVMKITYWSAGLMGVSILFFSMVFAAHMAWIPALVISFITGIIAGLILKMGGAWNATMIGLGILTLVMGFIISAIAGMG
ncbi:hypothetical protein MNBD_ALPHA06-618 [hydrothermal vent metagenome]|uniref:Cytochrome c oxidase subunit IV bacterial aa3 type domain-containing protein n=1 Tax=hydrothermal vent metagenome TaxID=652676 RepID=A0A3B0SJF4_9ZZZZ